MTRVSVHGATRAVPARRALVVVLTLFALVAVADAAEASVESDVHDAVNASRQRQGLPPLARFPDQSQAARANDDRIASGQAHRLQQQNMAFYSQRGAAGVAENQATTPTSASGRDIVAAWEGSPGHAANLARSDATHLAVAVRDTDGQRYATVHIVIDGPETPPAPEPEPDPEPEPAPPPEDSPAPEPAPEPAPDPASESENGSAAGGAGDDSSDGNAGTDNAEQPADRDESDGHDGPDEPGEVNEADEDDGAEVHTDHAEDDPDEDDDRDLQVLAEYWERPDSRAAHPSLDDRVTVAGDAAARHGAGATTPGYPATLVGGFGGVVLLGGGLVALARRRFARP